MKVLILGGYGAFGGRLAELLADVPALELLICGRNLAKAKDFCSRRQGKARFRPLQVDRAHIAPVLASEHPDVVVDASGPFQIYGDDPYLVVKACIDQRVSYLDLADGSDFVLEISQFDDPAKKAGVFVLSGLSTYPALTTAVMNAMSERMTVQSVRSGLAPSPYAGVGKSVIAAVLGYAGGTVRLTRNGGIAEAAGLTESLCRTIRPPGVMPLANRRFALVDVPDLLLLQRLFEGITDVWVGAAPPPEVLHRFLTLMAKARAALGLPSFAPLAGIGHRLLNLLRFGEHRSGLFVEASGTSDGKPVTLSWHVLAEGDDGPYIPCMAAETVIRKALEGERPANGARQAGGAVSLADYEARFQGRAIHAGFRHSGEKDLPLYRRVLGDAFDRLPAQLRALHGPGEERTWSGEGTVEPGSNILARTVGRLLGFPARAETVPVRVTFQPGPSGEVWLRRFGGKPLQSVQRAGRGRDAGLLLERFGPVTVSIALVAKEGRLFFVPRRWRFLGFPMPSGLLPSGDSCEYERDGQFHFDVSVDVPLLGRIVAYRGWLQPSGAQTRAA